MRWQRGLLLLALALSQLTWGKLAIRNIKVQQQWPWNALVDITYTIDSDIKDAYGDFADIRLTFSGHDLDRNQNITMTSLSGDGADGVVYGPGTYKVTWDAGKDYPDFNSSSFKVLMTGLVEDNPSQPSSKGSYLVIDLSGGTKAKSWPYRYASTPPNLQDATCKTSELWLRKIPAGTFVMGDARPKYEGMTKSITLTKPFYIGVFELTQKQWNLIIGYNDITVCRDDQCPLDYVTYDDLRGFHPTGGAGWPQYDYTVDSQSVLDVLRHKTGLLFELPTDAQWEYACRAGTTTSLNSGKELTSELNACPNLSELGRYKYNRHDGKGGSDTLARVGSYLPNKWGLYDMHGNVSERCVNWYEALAHYETTTDPKGPKEGPIRSVRGGNYLDDPQYCHSASWGSGGTVVGVRLICMPKMPIPKPLSGPAPQPGTYLVIDVSGGPNASYWPHRITQTPPDLYSDVCRTSEIWLRKIPAGTFYMGTQKGLEPGYSIENQNYHRVTISKPFYIGIFEFTQGQWENVMDMKLPPGSMLGDNRPIVYVTYQTILGNGQHTGKSFMEIIRQKTRLPINLPTEAQWEYACRAGTTTALNLGKDPVDTLFPYNDLTVREVLKCDVMDRFTFCCSGYMRVGSRYANAWGLYDMHGNVAEMCRDYYEFYLGFSPVTDPEGPTEGDSRTLRGGAYYNSLESCTSSARTSTNETSGDMNVGFRISCDNLP